MVHDYDYDYDYSYFGCNRLRLRLHWNVIDCNHDYFVKYNRNSKLFYDFAYFFTAISMQLHIFINTQNVWN